MRSSNRDTPNLKPEHFSHTPNRDFSMRLTLIGGLTGVGLAIVLGVAQTTVNKAPKMPNINVVVQHFDKEEEVKYPFGMIRWLMSSKIDSGSAQTFGIVQINAHQHNALHSHPCSVPLVMARGPFVHWNPNRSGGNSGDRGCRDRPIS